MAAAGREEELELAAGVGGGGTAEWIKIKAQCNQLMAVHYGMPWGLGLVVRCPDSDYTMCLDV